MLTASKPLSTVAALAKKWQVSTRTIHNWKRRGLDLTNDADLVLFIAGSRKATASQLAACADILAAKLPLGDGIVAGLRNGTLPR